MTAKTLHNAAGAESGVAAFDYRTKDGCARAVEFLLANDYMNVYRKLPRDQIIKYIYKNTRRILYSLSLIPALPAGARVLEIGAIPYCFSTLLIESLSCRLTSVDLPPTIFPGEPYTIADEEVVIPNTLTGASYSVRSWTCNAERDRYPFQDASFDAVVCTEVLEHLLYSPAHVLKECARVLKSGGTMLLSTVNSLHYKRMVDLILNENIDDGHSLFGPYVRHNRNWSRKELIRLTQDCGFGIRCVTSATLRGSRAAQSQGQAAAAQPASGKGGEESRLKKNFRKAVLNFVKLAVQLPLPGMRDKRHYNIFMVLEKK